MAENTTFVIYDCENDRVRTKVSEICLDYGLMRIQFSAFMGKLSRTMREELFLKLCDQLGESPARILMQPICDTDETLRKVKEQKVQLLGKVPPELRDQKSSPKSDSRPSEG
ncbi:MAG: CRISPR-associated endonuclease Cas2 [Terriglobales bacterium]